MGKWWHGGGGEVCEQRRIGHFETNDRTLLLLMPPLLRLGVYKCTRCSPFGEIIAGLWKIVQARPPPLPPPPQPVL